LIGYQSFAVAKIQEIYETRHLVPSRSAGFPIMWLVAPLSRIHFYLRSWLISFMFLAHTIHGSGEEFM